MSQQQNIKDFANKLGKGGGVGGKLGGFALGAAALAYGAMKSVYTGDAIALNPGYLKLRKIRAAQQIARTMAASQNKVYLDAGSLMLNIADKEYDITASTIVKKK
ncbi:Prohibitin-2 [Halotydeus destructor]|nr:Prohibitin-2 [Halotydeus destructor]